MSKGAFITFRPTPLPEADRRINRGGNRPALSSIVSGPQGLYVRSPYRRPSAEWSLEHAQTRSTILYEGRIPLNLPGYRLSYWFRRCLRYWQYRGEGTVYKAHQDAGPGDDWDYNPSYYGGHDVVFICKMYCKLNPHVIQPVIGPYHAYRFIWKGE